jgi:hypothetical protein
MLLNFSRDIQVVMISVVTAQREILLSPTGTNVWSGQTPQRLNSAAVTWSLAKHLYGFQGPYWIIPLSLLIGMIPTFIQYLIHRVRHPLLCLFMSVDADELIRVPVIELNQHSRDGQRSGPSR